MIFNNYQLYRTTPKLSGNMKMDLVVYDFGGKLYVKDFHIRPLSNLIPYNIIDENITIRPHQLNIARFYSKTCGDFYKAKADPQLLSDWPIMIRNEAKQKRIQTWDDTYWAGTQRMLYKPYNTTHELLIPLWLESLGGDISELSIEIGLIPNGQITPIVTKTLSFEQTNNEYHNHFCKYLNEYFEYIGIAGGVNVGNNKCLNINLTKNESYIYGLNVEDGNIQTRTDFNITRNLLFRERPLLESNSLLTNIFSDVHLILPQLINLNLCFDISKWIPEPIQSMFNQTFHITTTVKVNGKPLEKRDLYTNHQFVPRPINYDIAEDIQSEVPHNALDYKFDYKCTDLIHKNKITQPICHWAMLENPDVLFNLYDGFGASYKGMTINHFFGSVNDVSNTVTDALIPNTSPFGPKRLGDGDDIDYVLNHVEKFVYDEPYFISLADGWVNGFRIKYEPKDDEEIREIFVAGMTTPFEHSFSKFKTSDTQTVTDPNYFAIWAARYDKDGKDTLPNTIQRDYAIINGMPDQVQDTRSDYDKKYDIALYHDMDNRWGFGEGGYNASHRLEVNSYGLYFCVKEIDWPAKNYTVVDEDGNKIEKAAKALVVLIWDQQNSRKDGVNDGLVFKSKRSFQNIGFIIESINRYIAYTTARAEKFGITDRDDFKLLKKLELFSDAAGHSAFSGVWYFNNTISQKQDNRISDAADEITYRKSQTADAYVYRFDGLIKPAMYPARLKKTTDFGMNYLWVKTFYNDPNYKHIYNKYSQTGIAPCYPSLGYDCVVNDKEYGEILNPDKPYRTDLKEYKWFDKSKVVQYPLYIEDTVNSKSADKLNDLELVVKDVIYKKLKNQIPDELYDADYIQSLYDINYELLRVGRAQENNQLLYTYKITMKLK